MTCVNRNVLSHFQNACSKAAATQCSTYKNIATEIKIWPAKALSQERGSCCIHVAFRSMGVCWNSQAHMHDAPGPLPAAAVW